MADGVSGSGGGKGCSGKGCSDREHSRTTTTVKHNDMGRQR